MKNYNKKMFKYLTGWVKPIKKQSRALLEYETRLIMNAILTTMTTSDVSIYDIDII